MMTAVPFVFGDLKRPIALTAIGAVAARIIAADKGFGYEIPAATAFFKTSIAFGAVVILPIMGIGLLQLVVLGERVFFLRSVEGG